MDLDEAEARIKELEMKVRVLEKLVREIGRRTRVLRVYG